MLCFFIPKKALQSLRPNVDEGFRNNVLKIFFYITASPAINAPQPPEHTPL